MERELVIVATTSVVQLITQIKKCRKEKGISNEKERFRRKKDRKPSKEPKLLFNPKKQSQNRSNIHENSSTVPKKWAALSDKLVGLK